MITIVFQWEGLLCSPLCVSGRVRCAHHCVSVGGFAVITIVFQWEGLLCSPLFVSGRVRCAHHCVSVGGFAVLTIGCQWEGRVCCDFQCPPAEYILRLISLFLHQKCIISNHLMQPCPISYTSLLYIFFRVGVKFEDLLLAVCRVKSRKCTQNNLHSIKKLAVAILFVSPCL